MGREGDNAHWYCLYRASIRANEDSSARGRDQSVAKSLPLVHQERSHEESTPCAYDHNKAMSNSSRLQHETSALLGLFLGMMLVLMPYDSAETIIFIL